MKKHFFISCIYYFENTSEHGSGNFYTVVENGPIFNARMLADKISVNVAKFIGRPEAEIGVVITGWKEISEEEAKILFFGIEPLVMDVGAIG